MKDKNIFYAIHITFHPEPRGKQIQTFPTQNEAQDFINQTQGDGECWVIVQKIDDETYIFIRGFWSTKK